jgi:hypothetical protein
MVTPPASPSISILKALKPHKAIASATMLDTTSVHASMLVCVETKVRTATSKAKATA